MFPLLSISIKAQSVLFYNTENLFDTIDDTGVNDVEFLPEGTKEFGSIRYRLCIRQTSRALRLSILSTALPLELIGLCEVENRTVLDDLKNHRGLGAQEIGKLFIMTVLTAEELTVQHF